MEFQIRISCSTDTEINVFNAVPYNGGVAITKYIGFDDKNIRIPHSIGGKQVISIDEKAFYKADNIETIEIPEGVTSIGDSCFESCEKLWKVSLPSTLKAIGSSAFLGTALKSIAIPNSVFFLGSYAFASTPIEQLVLSTSLYVISDSAFSCCEKLSSVYIPEGVSKISECAFSDCDNLSLVALPNGLLEIEDQAFCNCSKLTEIDIPPTVKKIGENVFDGRYTVRPDRRYNPRTEYRKQSITIKCIPGSFAQEYARANEMALARTENDYKTGYRTNIRVYFLRKSKYSYSWNEYATLDTNNEALLISFLKNKDCEWAKINSTTICVKSNDSQVEAKSTDYSKSINGIIVRKAY